MASVNTVIQTNSLALNAHRNMSVVGAIQEKASKRLSSGYRINSAADDAAGLAISEKMRAQIRGLNMASKNTQDAVSMIQTAEGGMQEIDNMLQRIRELVNQSSSDTNEHNAGGSGDRQKMQDEIDALTSEIDSMGERVEFNKKKLINGNYAAKASATVENELATARGSYAAAHSNLKHWQDITANKTKLDTLETAITTTFKDAVDTLESASNVSKETVAKGKAIYTQVEDAWKSLIAAGDSDEADAAEKAIAKALADFTAYEGGLSAGDDKTAATAFKTAITTANSAVTTAGVKTIVTGLETAITTAETTLATKQDAYDTASKTQGLYFQVGANANQGIELSIGAVKSDVLGIGDGNGNSTINILRLSGKNITKLLDRVDNALSYVTTERSKLGAVQNRLEYTERSLDISSENLSAAESRIRDTDMAKEMMQQTKANILQQASMSMLAAANQNPQNVLQLLR